MNVGIEPCILRALLRYDPSTGLFTWKERARNWFSSERIFKSWNTQNAGKPALNALHNEGYCVGAILGQNLFAHRVAYAYCYGWGMEIDRTIEL